MTKAKGSRRTRRAFTPHFTADVVRLVRSGKSPVQVARELDLTETALREWVKRADADDGVPGAKVLAKEEREEPSRLRREIKQLRLERESIILALSQALINTRSNP